MLLMSPSSLAEHSNKQQRLFSQRARHAADHNVDSTHCPVSLPPIYICIFTVFIISFMGMNVQLFRDMNEMCLGLFVCACTG